MSSSDEVLDILDDPDADIILCSREHHKFRVLKLHVTKVSPVLNDLIQSASTSHAANPTSPLPSVQLPDSGAILSSLLTFILPMLPVLPSTPGHTVVLLSTAQKYQMDSIMSRIRAMIALQTPPLIRRETAFQVYYLARMHGLRQEALQAARTTLTFPFTFEDLEDELEAIHGIYLHELWKYYKSVRTHLQSDLEAFRATGMPALMCPPCGSNTVHGARVWLDSYVASIAESPALFDLTEFYACFSRHIIQRRCSCSLPNNAVRTFWTDLSNVVHSCMTKVSLDGL
jgi:BTB/POZ domain